MQYLIKLLFRTATKAILLIGLFYLYSLLQAHVLHVDEDRRLLRDFPSDICFMLLFVSFVASFVQVEREAKDQNSSSPSADLESHLVRADQNGLPS
ncbi:putative transmembrane protein [Rhodopirellula islandica]|uniref:Transmembrane protein n=1 Tax=Rhodopirellula islandica TaxID=595434 RepID=A0A0J1EP22_RHOIS|nr:hypothetical protein [Rhodopirellula islandica]KLU07239.1 putative transmembrane protein [Rhodopirellula islandica]